MLVTARKVFMSATMTAFQKPNGGVRGIATGIFPTVGCEDAGTPVWEGSGATCALFQFSLSTRARIVCYMLSGPLQKPIITRLCCLLTPSLQGLLPFVHATYANPTSYVWEDEDGVQHRIVQAEGSEQGDPLMPLLSAWRSTIHCNRLSSEGIQLTNVCSPSWTMCISLPKSLAALGFFTTHWEEVV